MKKSTTGLSPDTENLLPSPGELLVFRDNGVNTVYPEITCWTDDVCNLSIPYGTPALVYRSYLNEDNHLDEPYYAVDVMVLGKFSKGWQLTAFEGLVDIPVT
jgi:hypothetical protein